jgi:hypothetical protein
LCCDRVCRDCVCRSAGIARCTAAKGRAHCCFESPWRHVTMKSSRRGSRPARARATERRVARMSRVSHTRRRGSLITFQVCCDLCKFHSRLRRLPTAPFLNRGGGPKASLPTRPTKHSYDMHRKHAFRSFRLLWRRRWCFACCAPRARQRTVIPLALHTIGMTVTATQNALTNNLSTSAFTCSVCDTGHCRRHTSPVAHQHQTQPYQNLDTTDREDAAPATHQSHTPTRLDTHVNHKVLGKHSELEVKL